MNASSKSPHLAEPVQLTGPAHLIRTVPNFDYGQEGFRGFSMCWYLKAAGIDKISGRFLKDGANFLEKPIANICNIPISSGLFPNDCKIAK